MITYFSSSHVRTHTPAAACISHTRWEPPIYCMLLRESVSTVAHTRFMTRKVQTAFYAQYSPFPRRYLTTQYKQHPNHYQHSFTTNLPIQNHGPHGGRKRPHLTMQPASTVLRSRLAFHLILVPMCARMSVSRKHETSRRRFANSPNTRSLILFLAYLFFLPSFFPPYQIFDSTFTYLPGLPTLLLCYCAGHLFDRPPSSDAFVWVCKCV